MVGFPGADTVRAAEVRLALGDSRKRFSRRSFLKTAAAGAAGTCVAGVAAYPRSASAEEARVGKQPVAPGTSEKPELPVRTLGRTGLKLTVVGYGSEFIADPGLVEHIVSRGVKFIDAAPLYQEGNAERKLAPILKKHGTDIIVSTKCHTTKDGSAPKETFLTSFGQSCERMQVDKVDLFLVHDCRGVEAVNSPGAREAFEELRNAGRVKFLGMSTHLRQAECVQAAAELGWYDFVYVAWNFMSPERDTDALKAAADKGLGIVTMKTCKSLTPGRDYWPRAGEQHLAKLGEGDPFVKSIQWSLGHDFVTAVLMSMQNYEQADTDIGAAGLKAT